MRSLLIIILFICLSSCNHVNRVDHSDITLNFRDYFYPVSKLVSARFYIYKNEISGGYKYRKLQTMLSNGDTLLNITSYDSLFRQTDLTQLKIVADSLVSVSETSNDYSGAIKGEMAIHFLGPAFPCKQTVYKDTISFDQASEFSAGLVKFRIRESGHLEELEQPLSPLYPDYKYCVRVFSVFQMSSNIPLRGVKLITSHTSNIFSKGIGLVEEEEPAISGKGGKKFILTKIITPEEFAHLK